MTAKNRVDPSVEEPLRYSFAYAIDHDIEKARDALSSLSDRQLGAAMSYAMHVIGYVVNDVFTKADEGASLIAEKDIVPDVSSWFDGIGTVDEVYAFVHACAIRNLDEPPKGVDQDKIPDMAIVIGGYLLGRFRPEGMRWSDYLDQIWNHAESLPGQA